MTAVLPVTSAQAGLAPWSLFAALIAMAGLPIYIHAPKFYADTFGVSLAALGGTLAVLRLIDVVQDPLLGWLVDAGRRHRGRWVALASTLMALAMAGLFAVTPPIAPLIWFAAMLTLLFSSFSFLTIAFYAEGVGKAARMGAAGHLRLAGWREAGALAGVSLAAVAPTALGFATGAPFAAFALGFALFAVIATLAMRHEWGRTAAPPSTSPLAVFRPVLADPLGRRLLLIALVNAAPVAVTSTLFLFFVESRLGVPELSGPLLLVFFLSAAASTPVWSRLAQRHGAKPVLMLAMSLAILAFIWAATLGAGDTLAFAVISALSGAALGADMTLLPAIFARRLAALGNTGAEGAFGLWSFMSKMSLTLAAAVLLPVLDGAGFVSRGANSDAALAMLTLLYAGLPCALKLVAVALLAVTRVPEV